MNLLLALFLILTEALYEGFKIRQKHILSATIEFIHRMIIILIAFAWVNGITFQYEVLPFTRVIIGFIFLRFGIFDVILNLSAGLKLYYIGSTKLFDKGLQWVISMWGMSPIWLLRFIATFWGISWLILKH